MHVEQVNMVALLYFDIMQSVNVDRGLRFCVVLASLWAYFYTLKCKNERIEPDEHHTKNKVQNLKHIALCQRTTTQHLKHGSFKKEVEFNLQYFFIVRSL